MPDGTMTVTVRAATLADLEPLLDLRVALFEGMGQGGQALEEAVPAMRDYFRRHLPSGAFRVWVAEYEGDIVASIGLVIHRVPPSPSNLLGAEAYIMNLVTRPAYRRRGIARRLMAHVLDVVNREGIPKASLHASADGRHLYEQLGFEDTPSAPEMQLRFSESPSRTRGRRDVLF
jgi:ribosomal protein S18 acetylase RimI-like enzyme